jgi:methylated-DNA-[protein]-cysteine S-methyltransferase
MKQSKKTIKIQAQSKSILITSPLGTIALAFQHDKLSKLEFLAGGSKKPPRDSLTKHIAAELAQYFKNPKHSFNISMHLDGTPFQKTVWRALQQIPPGKTMTYGELAKKLKTSPRAIGQACRTNPIPIIVPCHRIIAANHLGGYAGKLKGKMMDIKQWLLQHEKQS